MKKLFLFAACITAALIITFLIPNNSADNSENSLLVISDNIENPQTLAAAAGDGLKVVTIKSATTSPADIIKSIKSLGTKKYKSIGLAVHDYGEGKFYLSGKDHVSLTSLSYKPQLRQFWQELGGLVEESGSIDIFACNLAAGPEGKKLLVKLQELSGVAVNASSNETGNLDSGGDWVLETSGRNLADYYFNASLLTEYDGLLISKIKKLVPPDSVEELGFGRSVAISAGLAVVSRNFSPQDDNGALYIYRKDKYGTSSWGLSRILRIRPSYDFKDFGKYVAIDGDTIATSAITKIEGDQTIREVFIFQQDKDDPDKWRMIKRLESPDEMYDEGFGELSLALYGDFLAVSDALDDETADNSGAVYLFHRDLGGSDNWGLVKKIKDDFPVVDDNWGKVLDLDEDMLIVRNYEPQEGGGTGPGSAELLYKDQLGSNNWGRLKRLFLEDGVAGDRYGWAAKVSGDFLVVSASHRDDKGTDSGAVYIYQKHRGGTYNWGFLKKLVPSELKEYDYFGASLDLADDVLLVGAPGDDNGKGENAGLIYVYHRNKGGENNWGLSAKYIPDDGFENQMFGSYVATSQELALVGVPEDNPSGEKSGSAYIIDVKQSGILKGVVRPSRPRKDGGMWSIEGRDEWYKHLQKISLPPGTYTLIAKPVDGYKVKYTSTVTVVANKSVRGRVVYEPDEATMAIIMKSFGESVKFVQ